jgi:hypothetical protein
VETGQEEGFGVVEDGRTEHLTGGTENMEVDRDVEAEPDKVNVLSANDGKVTGYNARD